MNNLKKINPASYTSTPGLQYDFRFHSLSGSLTNDQLRDWRGADFLPAWHTVNA
ncbi:hypothetical protein [Spirosoma sp.]|uniref:hypothetical protein n=1 Tax=Spirosoma sp. TaxID=1899569 RepID=UPI002639CF3E|nr:hypothetical protein [Spirosoma sp.]MCX6212901.1 hypothetical protein [Spirosoma sp.]